MASDEKTKELVAKVKTIISEQLGVDESEITPSSSFVDDLGADSLDQVELVMALEEAFERRDFRRGCGKHPDRAERHRLHRQARQGKQVRNREAARLGLAGCWGGKAGVRQAAFAGKCLLLEAAD